MKKKGPSNVFTIPSWMKNLRAKEPEGTRTPDQVASSLELSMLIHNDVDMLKDLIITLVPQVPLKHQPYVHALLQGDVIANAQAFIDKSNASLAQLQQEVTHAEPEPQIASGQSDDAGSPAPEYWEDDSDLRSKPSSRGRRAVRNAKRQAFES